MTTPAISFEHVSLAYRKHTVLADISMQIALGTLTAVVGANGCGKSTLIKAIAGIIEPAGGSLQVAFAPEHIAYLSQISEVDRSFPITVFDFVACALWAQTGAFQPIHNDLSTRIHMALDAVGMQAYARTLIGELSGGQFQRIRFAQLILQRARLLLLDEPFTGIDEPTTADLMRILHHWHNQGATLLVVMHNMALARQQFPHALLLGQRQVLACGLTAECLHATHPLEPA